jgi:hypothetical protein
MEVEARSSWENRLGQSRTEWLKMKWPDDFIVIWSASFCAQTQRQETTSEDGCYISEVIR